MGLVFQFSVPNIDGFKLRLRGIPPKMTDLTDVWPGAAGPLTNMILNQYNTQGARGAHGAWAELDPAYAARKRRKYGSKPIMQASGKSFAALLSADAFHYEPRRMTFGVGPEFGYLLYQQTGFRTRLGTVKRVARALGFRSMFTGKIGLAQVPARRIFDPIDADRRGIQRGLAKSLTNKLRRAGYAAWSSAMETSEWPLQTLTPGQARLAGIAYYGG
jgi:hypothetical protein